MPANYVLPNNPQLAYPQPMPVIMVASSDGGLTAGIASNSNPIPVTSSSSAPSPRTGIVWDGSEIDCTGYNSIIIWCEAVPTVKRDILTKGRAAGVYASQAAKTGTLLTPTHVDVLGRYTVEGNCWIKLDTPANGGTYYLSLGNN